MAQILRSLFIMITLLTLLGCGNSDGNQPPGTGTRSDKERVTSPQVAAPDQAELVSGNSVFAVNLYHALKAKQDNFFYSPYSISLALAMTYAGARGETEQQMADTLHFTLPQNRLHPAFNGLDLELARRGEGAAGKDGQGFRLNIVNALWGQTGYAFLPEFLDLLAENYGAGLNLLDFVKAPEESRGTINKWVGEQTEGKIEELIPAGVIDGLTRLVLTNAIYFNAAWAAPFAEQSTEDKPFHLPNGEQVIAPMMWQSTSLGYAEGEGYQAVELPYDGRELSMVILLPEAGEFAAFEDSLEAEQADTILQQLRFREVALTLPRFKIDSGVSLAQTLESMGMPAAFSAGADFSGMDGTRELFIRDVIHQAVVTVDEAGTEAAAATAVVMALRGALEPPIEVTVDRPFIFLIRDIETGTILFVGRVMNPTA